MEDVLAGESEEVEAQQTAPPVEEAQEEKPKRRKATLDLLKKKQRVTRTVSIAVTGDDGDVEEVELTFRAISAPEYDKLQSRFPPRQQDKKQGYTYNPDKFGPAIIAETCIDPEMTVEDATEIWESDQWNRGERLLLFSAAVEVCTAGLNVPFTSPDSE